MKKIISALVIGATAAGIATADLTLQAGIRVAPMLYRYNTDLEGGSKLKQKKLFDMQGYADPNNDVKMTASGNIFTFYTQLTPTVEADDIQVKAATIAAKVGNFTFTTGFNNGGTTVLSMKDVAKGNDEGGVTGETYKLGSIFDGSPALLANSQTGFFKDEDNYFAQAKYGLPLGDTFTLNLAAAAISPHGFAYSYRSAEDNTWHDASGKDLDNHSMGWALSVNPVIKKLISVDLVAKGFCGARDGNATYKHYNHVFAGYVNLLCVPVLSNAVFGGSVWLNDGDLMEWNADLSLGFKLLDGRLNIGFNNKFAFHDGGGKSSSKVGYGTQYDGAEYMLYDVLSASFKLNDTLTIRGSVGQQSAFKDVKDKPASTGTTIYVYPRAEIFATSSLSVTAGAIFTLDKLGYKKHGEDNVAVTGDAKKMAILVNVPFTMKFSL